MQLFVRDVSDVLHPIDVELHTTVSEFKKGIHIACGVDASIINLTYAGVPLKEDKNAIIWDGGLQPFDILDLEMSLAGQAAHRLTRFGIKVGAKEMILSAQSDTRHSLAVLQLQLNAGVDVDSRLDHGGETALIIAAQSSNVAAAKLLISQHCDLNIKSSSGRSALHYAINNNCYEIVELLAHECADLYALFPDGSTPLHQAIQRGFAKIAEVIYKNTSDRQGAFELALEVDDTNLAAFFAKEHLKANLSHSKAVTASEELHPLASSIHPEDLIDPPSPDKVKRPISSSPTKRSCYEAMTFSKTDLKKVYIHPINAASSLLAPEQRKRLSFDTFSIDRLGSELKRSCLKSICVG
eukprot:TRINITY_DN1008_c1_g1_i1.p1 TRINITY_DN1008_c1_g1~~TRINITY_DN1008_c1_g1_i1.p1  ORF type:complete len:354 (+),score=46.37 TRINITY_DN1008_c1_g1_i1:53-1114(+)